jgi:hypothetical protein
MLHKSIPLLFVSIGMLVQISPAPLRAWDLEEAGLVRVSIPTKMASIAPGTQTDFDGDGRMETLSLTNGKATLLSQSNTVWESPQGWQVIQAEITDLDHDGAPEVALLVWRPFQPWPVDRWLPNGGRIADFHDAAGYSCHIILIGRVHGDYQEVWAGSALAEPVRAFAAADLKRDGTQELITLESTYNDPRSAPARILKVWEWNSFGFTVVSTIEGTFSKMVLVQASDGRILILVP